MRTASNRMSQIPFSGIREVLEAVEDLEARGEDVIRLEIGRPDFDTPTHIKAAATQALGEGKVHYSSNYGIPDLRASIAEKLQRENQLDFDPSDEVVVTTGAVEAVFITMMGLLNPNDEVLIMDPFWPSYGPCTVMAGASPISVPLRISNGFQPAIEDITSRITERTRMIVINTPHNPTGTTLDITVLEALSQIAIENDLLVLSDEIYEKIIYDDVVHTSIASLPGMRRRTITLTGLSNAFALTGWRIGYLAADRSIVRSVV